MIGEDLVDHHGRAKPNQGRFEAPRIADSRKCHHALSVEARQWWRVTIQGNQTERAMDGENDRDGRCIPLEVPPDLIQVCCPVGVSYDKEVSACKCFRSLP